MKKWLTLVVILCALSGTAGAQLPPVGYIGLFTDDNRDTWCVNGVGFYQFEMWVWCLPSDEGMICAEFAISYPGNVVQSVITLLPPIIIPEGFEPETGVNVCFTECQVQWTWAFHQTLFVSDASPSHLEIIKHSDPDIEYIRFATCEPGNPTEPVKKFTNLYINYDPAGSPCTFTATESRSWGAIKNLVER
ncbi:MAG TPA: hypothetical protein VMX58_00485 [Patescibacteria group bacterium]|nr:hypothetical protein [Patescibacteria group bacterium]